MLSILIGVAPASLVCGSSQYITWKVHRLGEKQLGVIGAIISLFGLSLVLIEPLVLFSYFTLEWPFIDLDTRADQSLRSLTC